MVKNYIKNGIYRIMNSVEHDGSEQIWGDSPESIGAEVTAVDSSVKKEMLGSIIIPTTYGQASLF